MRAALKKVNEGGDGPDDAEVAAALPIEAQLAKLAERVAALEGKA